MPDHRHRQPRPPRPRPAPPPLDAVSAAAVKLAQADPTNPVVGYCRSRAELADRMVRVEAMAYEAKLKASPGELEIMTATARDRAVASRLGRGERTIRRWRTGL